MAKTIELETLVTLVCTEFVKQNRKLLRETVSFNEETESYRNYVPYLKMNFIKRQKLSQKLLDEMEKEYRHHNES